MHIGVPYLQNEWASIQGLVLGVSRAIESYGVAMQCGGRDEAFVKVLCGPIQSLMNKMYGRRLDL